MNRSGLKKWGALLACVAACGQGDDASPETYTPGPAGRAAGLSAVVEVDGAQISSNEIEIILKGEEADDPMTPRSARSAEPIARWSHRDPTTTLAAPRTIPARYEAMFELVPEVEPSAACEGSQAGEEVTEMPTMDGRICYTSFTYAVGALSQEEAATVFVWMGPEGMYVHGSFDLNLYYPPDFFHGGISTGVGCIVTPDGGPITKEYIDSLVSLGISFNAGPISAGYTFFAIPGQGMQRALQYDTGISVSADLLPFFPLGMSVQETTIKTTPLRVLTGWGDESCAEPLFPDDSGAVFASSGNALTAMGGNLRAMADDPGQGYRGALRGEIARSFAPVANMLGAPTGLAVGDGVPAQSNADWFGEFLARPGGEQCVDCASTSIDGMLYDFQQRINDAEDTGDIFAAGSAVIEAGNQGMPEPVRQGALQMDIVAGVDLALELAADLAAERRGDEHRYVAQNIETIEVSVGEEAVLDVTAEEIAALLDVDAAALEGATVVYDAEPHVEKGEFAIEDGVSVARLTPSKATKLLTRVTVDLSTAVGPLPEGAETWVVRPAMRLLKPKAGPPAAAYLGAPGVIPSGAPAMLSATLLDKDNNVVRDGAQVTFFDAEGELGTAEAVDGTATLRVSPAPSQPVIAGVEAVTLTFGDGTEAPGQKISGQGFSRDAIIEVDGESLDDLGAMFAIKSSTEILFEGAPIGAGEHVLTVTNPEGIATEAFAFSM